MRGRVGLCVRKEGKGLALFMEGRGRCRHRSHRHHHCYHHLNHLTHHHKRRYCRQHFDPRLWGAFLWAVYS